MKIYKPLGPGFRKLHQCGIRLGPFDKCDTTTFFIGKILSQFKTQLTLRSYKQSAEKMRAIAIFKVRYFSIYNHYLDDWVPIFCQPDVAFSNLNNHSHAMSITHCTPQFFINKSYCIICLLINFYKSVLLVANHELSLQKRLFSNCVLHIAILQKKKTLDIAATILMPNIFQCKNFKACLSGVLRFDAFTTFVLKTTNKKP